MHRLGFATRFLYAARVVAVILVATKTSPAAEKPNVIFILADDHRYDAMSCAGHEIVKTPNLDELAKRGVRFRNAFVTTSICAASRASILTGLHERTHKFTFGTPPIASEFTATSYPALLKEVGYRTGFVGKFGVSVEEGATEEMFDYFKPLRRSPYFKETENGKRHLSQIAGDRAIEFLGECNKEQPFCLSISFNAPHAEDNDKANHYPWPAAVDRLYEDIEVPAPRLSDPYIFESQPEFLRKSMNRDRWFWRWDTPEKYQKNIKGYYRMISGIDHVVGRVVKETARLGFAENTVIIFLGDNGYYAGSRGFAGKWSHYEESLRVPLIIFDPREEKRNTQLNINQDGNRTIDSVCLNIDVLPTILELAEVAPKKHHQGNSLMHFVQNSKIAAPWREDFFCEHLFDNASIPKWEGVRGKRWAYARYFEQDPPFEFLHDLENDPDQLKNLATDENFKEQLKIARARCLELRDSYGGEYTKEKFPRRRR